MNTIHSTNPAIETAFKNDNNTVMPDLIRHLTDSGGFRIPGSWSRTSFVRNDTHFASISSQASLQNLSELKAESLMLEVELLVAKDFDEQMRTIGEQIKFLSDIKKKYRENINHLHNFLTQNTNSSRKDGQRYIEASAKQMEKFMDALVVYDYNLENQTCDENSLLIHSNGDNQSLDEKNWTSNENGRIKTQDLKNYFAKGSQFQNPGEARKHAQTLGDDNNHLPFYYGHTNNQYENGFPKFSVFVDDVEKFMDQLKNKLTNVEEDTEKLSVSLNQISAQRKMAIDGIYQLIQKMDQIRNNTISKLG